MLALSAACGPTQAKTPADDVPLTTPAAPPRVIVPVTIEAPALVEPAKPPSRDTATAPPAKPAPSGQTSTPPPSTPTTPQTDQPGSILQTTANVTEAEKRVRTTLAKAQADLARVDYKSLGEDARAQFDQARRFVEQATAALKVKNVVFAGQLAEKAASLAALLVRRQ